MEFPGSLMVTIKLQEVTAYSQEKVCTQALVKPQNVVFTICLWYELKKKKRYDMLISESSKLNTEQSSFPLEL